MDQPIPVILDTDIGDDIDDTWALALLLKCPELDLRLVTVATGDTPARARLAARLLHIAGRDDIPIGVGPASEPRIHRQPQAIWAAEHDPNQHPQMIHADGVEAMISTIMSSQTPTTLIAIGPVTNIAAALQREPAIAARTRLIAMMGCLSRHHVTNMNARHMADGVIPEWNVVCDIDACRQVVAAPWLSFTITPVDSCGQIMLDGDHYQTLRRSDESLLAATLENYRLWSPDDQHSDPRSHSSVLFDTAAVYAALTQDNCIVRDIRIKIAQDGSFMEDPDGRRLRAIVDWHDLDRLHQRLTERLLMPPATPIV